MNAGSCVDIILRSLSLEDTTIASVSPEASLHSVCEAATSLLAPTGLLGQRFDPFAITMKLLRYVATRIQKPRKSTAATLMISALLWAVCLPIKSVRCKSL